MADDKQAYALYLNPSTNKYELSYYNTTLDEPLSEDDERKIITCYIPAGLR